jgi:hypothetical protein
MARDVRAAPRRGRAAQRSDAPGFPALVSDREAIEKRMTDEVRARLAMRGIRVAAATVASPSPPA